MITLLLTTIIALAGTTEPTFRPLFNGTDLSGWVNMNGDDSTWRAESGMIRCTGKPVCLLRTDRVYENFILEFQWRHESPKGNAGLFVWADALPAVGTPFTRAIEVQVMIGTETPNYTSEGDIFSIWGAVMTPDRPHPAGWARCLPSEARTKGAGEWNHYRVECIDGRVTLAVNGAVVSGGFDCNPRRGYICLEAEGSPIDFKDILISELPSEASPWAEGSNEAVGFEPIFNGLDLDDWKLPKDDESNWEARGGRIIHNGEGGDLWTQGSYENFDLIVDWRWTDDHQGEMDRPVILPDGREALDEEGNPVTTTVLERDSGIFLRGSSKSQVNLWCWSVGSGEVWGYRTDQSMTPEVRSKCTPRVKADNPVGEWNRYFIRIRGDKLTVVLNGQTVIEEATLPGVPMSGPIGLQSHGNEVEFTNVLIRPVTFDPFP